MKVKEEMEKQKEEFRKRWAIKEDKESEEKETNERETSKEPEKAPLPTGKNFEIVLFAKVLIYRVFRSSTSSSHPVGTTEKGN